MYSIFCLLLLFQFYIVTESLNEISPPLFYHDLDSILNFFNQTQYKENPSVQELLDIYRNESKSKSYYNKNGHKYPIIVLEGLAGSGKTTTGKLLAKKINGTQIHSAPDNIKHLLPYFKDDYNLETAYYALGHYIAALDILFYLKNSPVVVDRYWYSSASYWISQAVFNEPDKYTLPKNGSKIYEWPHDLLKPDIVFFLDVEENTRMNRINGRADIKNITKLEVYLNAHTEFRKNIIKVFKNMDNPTVHFVNSNLPLPEVLKDIYERIKYLL